MKRKAVMISAAVLAMVNLWGCGDGSFPEADFSGILEGLKGQAEGNDNAQNKEIEDIKSEDKKEEGKGQKGREQEATEKKKEESEKAAEDAERIKSLADRVAEAGKKGADSYIIPDSDTAYIDKAFLESLTKEELRLARNEIFARHGRMFQDEELQRYFNSKSWYTALYTPDEFTAIHNQELNEFEKANLEAIQEVEGD